MTDREAVPDLKAAMDAYVATTKVQPDGRRAWILEAVNAQHKAYTELETALQYHFSLDDIEHIAGVLTDMTADPLSDYGD